MGLIKPNKLKRGDTIGIMNPSSFMLPERLEAGEAQLRKYGFNVFIHPQCYDRDRGAAGTTEQKVAALHDLFLDPSIHAIMAGRGGSRALHMLDGLDYDLIAKHPKIFIGFSDVTALHVAIYTRSNLSTVHGADLGRFDASKSLASAEATIPYLLGEWTKLSWPPDYPMEVIRAGDATGELFGGNLALLHAIAAAGCLPDLKNKILVVEDIGEEMRSIDRMLGALRLRGVFDRIAGLVVGQMTAMVDTDNVPFDRTVRDVVLEHTAAMKTPVVLNAPIGHEHPNIPFPIGIKARLTAPSNGIPQIQLLESPFADA